MNSDPVHIPTPAAPVAGAPLTVGHAAATADALASLRPIASGGVRIAQAGPGGVLLDTGRQRIGIKVNVAVPPVAVLTATAGEPGWHSGTAWDIETGESKDCLACAAELADQFGAGHEASAVGFYIRSVTAGGEED